MLAFTLPHRLAPVGAPSPADSVSTADGGHLEVLQYLRSQGIEWDGDVCSAAAHSGHFGVLAWARENGCEVRERKQFLST